MLIHPQFNPVAIAVGPIAIHWYAIMYVLGFIFFLTVSKQKIKQKAAPLRQLEDLDNLFVYGVLGVLLGGRLGYILFYQTAYYFSYPSEIIKVWQGGMSFHGGLLGAMLGIILFCYRYRYRFLSITDFVAPLVPVGLGLGRIGNFINGELWGRVTDPTRFWAIGFPQAHTVDKQLAPQLSPSLQTVFIKYQVLPRHASQLYEACLEGLLLFILLYLFTRKKRALGQTTGLFLLLYGCFRSVVEFSREPDQQLGLLALGLSMGQWLCLPMIIAGVILYFCAKSKLFNSSLLEDA